MKKMKNQSPVWVGLCKTCLGRGTRTYVGIDLRGDSSPGGRELEALLPLVPPSTFGAWARVPVNSTRWAEGRKG